jgi:hypothetical protein
MQKRTLTDAYRSVARLLEDTTDKEMKNQALILLRLLDVHIQAQSRRVIGQDEFDENSTSPG